MRQTEQASPGGNISTMGGAISSAVGWGEKNPFLFVCVCLRRDELNRSRFLSWTHLWRGDKKPVCFTACVRVHVPDRNIRHRACALKDTVRAIIRDELDEDFERVCEEIRESRIHRGETQPDVHASSSCC